MELAITRTKGALIALAISAALAGCGGGGSSSSSDSTDGGSGGSGGGDDSGATTTTTTITGKAADGYLVNATVCADLNADGKCGVNEPSTFSGNGGSFRLDIPEGETVSQILVNGIADVTTDEDTGTTISGPFRLIAAVEEGEDDVFVSPITTLVANHMNISGVNREEASEHVMRIIGVSVDPLRDFVALKDNTDDPISADEYEKVHRVAQVLARLEGEVRNKLVEENKSDDEGLDLVQLSLAERAEEIARGIMDEASGEFSPDDYSNMFPVHYIVRDAISGNNETKRRIASAEMGLSPYIKTTGREGSGQKPQELFLNYNQATGKIHVQSYATEYTENHDVTSKVEFRRTAVSLLDAPETNYEVVGSGDPEEAFLVWSSQDNAFSSVTAKDELGTRTFEPTPGGSEATLDGTIYSGAVRTSFLSKGLSLRFINEKDVIFELFGRDLPSDVFGDYNANIYPDRSWAYITTEMLMDDLFVVPWRTAEEFSNCSNGYYFEPKFTSCNLLPRVSFDPTEDPDFIARTLGEMTYPASYPETANFVTASRDGDDKDYTMILVDNGEIHIFPEQQFEYVDDSALREAIPFSRSDLLAKGSWDTVNEPFTHHVLSMPAGFEYNADRGDFHAGQPFVFEHEGYLRAGWKVPGGTTLSEMRGMSGPQIMVNDLAVGRTMAVLRKNDLLADTPFED